MVTGYVLGYSCNVCVQVYVLGYSFNVCLQACSDIRVMYVFKCMCWGIRLINTRLSCRSLTVEYRIPENRISVSAVSVCCPEIRISGSAVSVCCHVYQFVTTVGLIVKH